MVFFETAIRLLKNLPAKYVFPAILLLICSLQSCGTNRHLAEDAYLLDKNSIKIPGKIPGKGDLTEELATFYKQIPNTNWGFFVPRESFYFFTENKKDNGINRWLQKTLGEPPSIYSDSLTSATAADMELFLQYKGYYGAEVLPQRAPRKKKMRVTYYIETGLQFFVDTVQFHCPDPAVDSLLEQSKAESLFQTGKPVDLRLFAQEKKRITTFLQNNGYANFYSDYFDNLQIDTFQTAQKANLYINLQRPYKDSLHQKFHIGEVHVYPDYPVDVNHIDTMVFGVNYHLSDQGFIIKPETLLGVIDLKPGMVFNQANISKTYKQLSDLGIFRFVRIKERVDSLEPGLMHFDIQLTPNLKMEFGADLNLSYTDRTNTSLGGGGLIGLSFSPSVKNRNLFGGAELLSTSLSSGVEIAPGFTGSDEFWNTIDLDARVELQLPAFYDFLGIYKALYRFPPGKNRHLLTPEFYTSIQDNAHTLFSASYNYLKIIRWYSQNQLNVSYGYAFQRSKQTQYKINHFVLNYLQPTTEPRFDTILMANSFLENSFGDQLFISLLFRDLDFLHRSKVNRHGRSSSINMHLEVAGTEVWGINALYNAISGETGVFQLGNIALSQYLKIDGDYRINKQLTPDKSIAIRFNLGIARPFGYTDDVPYVKQFFVGGGNSMRAWAARGLGPGGYVDPLSFDSKNNYRLFQTGDFKFEMNYEYRFKLFWWFRGALFMDIGNVWTLKNDPDRPGSLFRFNQDIDTNTGFIQYPFYRQLAVASGAGLRVDLSYFIFRFDVGFKLRNSYPRETLPGEKITESLWWNDFKTIESNDFGFNLGLGFPF